MLSVALSRYTHVTLRHRICVGIHTWNMSHHGKGVEIQTWNMSRHGVCVEIHTWNMLRHGTLEMGDEFGWPFGQNWQRFKRPLTEPWARKNENELASFCSTRPQKGWHVQFWRAHFGTQFWSMKTQWRCGAVMFFFYFCGPVTGPPGCLCSSVAQFECLHA